MNKNINKIQINGEDYVKVSDVNIVPTTKQIVILNRGWVVVGDYSESEDKMECTLTKASVVRVWGTTKGLGELAENGPTSSTKLDPTLNIRFHKMTMVARIDCDVNNWK